MCRFCIAFMMVVVAVGCQSSDSPAPPQDLPELTVGSGVAGPYGEPPGEIKKLVPPMELVAAGGYTDGGTDWVHLRDAQATEVVFCVTEAQFESAIPHNTLVVGGTHAGESSSRLPLSVEEVKMLIDALSSALEPYEDKPPYDFETGELRIHESSQRDWEIAYAFGVHTRLSHRTEFELADRDEVKKQIWRLTSVDLNEVGREFRNASPDDRAKQWYRLAPALAGHLRSENIGDPRAFLIELLGEPDPKAISESDRMFDSPVEDGRTSDGHLLGYQIERDGSVYQYVKINLRDPRRIQFQVCAVAKAE